MNRKIPLVTGEYYHVYNRGVDKRIVFTDAQDYERFLESLSLFNNTVPTESVRSAHLAKVPIATTDPLVEIICYCLNPNHFHLLLRQSTDQGISEFMKRIGGGYTNYFNKKHDRSGSLFQGKFKSVHIDSNEYLLHLSAYINLNDQVHKYSDETRKQTRSSYDFYLDKKLDSLVNGSAIILDQFDDRDKYKTFCENSLPIMLAQKETDEPIVRLLLE